MEDNEIIKALEKALTDIDAPIGEHWGSGFLSTQTIKSAIDLIHRQAAEKEEFEFELIRSRNEMAAWKIRATGYKEMCSKLQCKNSELEIELKAMRGAANSYKSEVERLRETPKCIYAYDGETMEYCVEGPCSAEKTIEEIKSEARKEFAERLKEYTHDIALYGEMVTMSRINGLLTKMESEWE